VKFVGGTQQTGYARNVGARFAGDVMMGLATVRIALHVWEIKMADTYTKTKWEIEELDEEELTPQEYVWRVLEIMALNGLRGNYYWCCKTGFVGGTG